MTREDILIQNKVAKPWPNEQCPCCKQMFPPFGLNIVASGHALCTSCVIDSLRQFTKPFELATEDVRNRRNGMLNMTDQYMAPDRVSVVNKSEWAAWREKLRNLTTDFPKDTPAQLWDRLTHYDQNRPKG